MAIGLKNSLRMTFKDAGGENYSITLQQANDEAEDAQVKALCNGIVTNKAIFQRSPTSVIGAQLVSTTTSDYEVTD